MNQLTSGDIFEGRYRIDRPRLGGQGYLARALTGGARVELLQLAPSFVRALGPAKNFAHSRLTKILETLSRADTTAWLVVEHVPGSTLEQVLERDGKLPAEVAVMIGIDLSDALVGLHQRGGVHGLIRPAAVIVDPDDFSSAVLGFAPPDPGPNPFRLAESEGSVPTPAGDVWALAGVVHCMLLGETPPIYGYPSRDLVTHAGMPPDLIDFLAACLAQNPSDRVTSAHTMRDLLACSRANSLRPGAISAQPPPVEVLRPGPMPTVQQLSAPGVLAPSAVPLAAPRVEHISIPRPEVATTSQRRWIVAAAVIAVLTLAALLGVLML